MRIIDKSLHDSAPAYELQKIAPLSEYLFLDIETTGLHAEMDTIYLIGCIYYDRDEKAYKLRQWFAQNYDEEGELLSAFLAFAGAFRHLIHYNGDRFDIPFLKKRIQLYGLKNILTGMDSLDLYLIAKGMRRLFGLPNCKQQTLENFFDTGRMEAQSGGELIDAYESYTKDPSDNILHTLLDHNEADIRGLLPLTGLIFYHDLSEEELTVNKAQANYYDDYSSTAREEVVLFFALPVSLPKPIAGTADHCYMKAEGNKGVIKIPLYTEELKYFYANYKDYYYFPQEDMAIHKSIASFAEKSHREQAAPSTCYTRKTSSYLPQWDLFCEPFFKRSYEDSTLFFEMTDAIKKDRAFLSRYATYVFRHICSALLKS